MTHLVLLQVEEEIAALAALVKQEGCRSFLEIGSKFGGSLRIIAEALPAGSRVVAVDLPNGTKAWHKSKPALEDTVKELKGKGLDTHLIWGNSTDPSVIDQIRKLGPFDFIFIDADHRLPGVTSDWNNYGPMSKMVAFHDIAWRRETTWNGGVEIDVPKFWEALKGDYRHEEFRFCPTGKNNGIGVLWKN